MATNLGHRLAGLLEGFQTATEMGARLDDVPAQSSDSMTSSTADPAAAWRGLEAKVLKYRDRRRNVSTRSFDATAPQIGIPLPIGFPIVTMSGTKPILS